MLLIGLQELAPGKEIIEMIYVFDTEVNRLMRTYKDQNISDFHQVRTCSFLCVCVTFHSRYVICPFGMLVYLKSGLKE